MKKPRSVKTRISKLLQIFKGDKDALALELGCDVSYINKMLKGIIPGKHLYEYIVRYYEKIQTNGKDMGH